VGEIKKIKIKITGILNTNTHYALQCRTTTTTIATIFLGLPIILLTKINMTYRVLNLMQLNFSYNNYKDKQYFLVFLPTIVEPALQN
jgi:hypothetical protein